MIKNLIAAAEAAAVVPEKEPTPTACSISHYSSLNKGILQYYRLEPQSKESFLEDRIQYALSFCHLSCQSSMNSSNLLLKPSNNLLKLWFLFINQLKTTFFHHSIHAKLFLFNGP